MWVPFSACKASRGTYARRLFTPGTGRHQSVGRREGAGQLLRSGRESGCGCGAAPTTSWVATGYRSRSASRAQRRVEGLERSDRLRALGSGGPAPPRASNSGARSFRVPRRFAALCFTAPPRRRRGCVVGAVVGQEAPARTVRPAPATRRRPSATLRCSSSHVAPDGGHLGHNFDFSDITFASVQGLLYK